MSLFQRFELNLEAASTLLPVKPGMTHLIDPRAVNALKERGYSHVLLSEDQAHSLPKSILLGTVEGTNIQKDFNMHTGLSTLYTARETYVQR